MYFYGKEHIQLQRSLNINYVRHVAGGPPCSGPNVTADRDNISQATLMLNIVADHPTLFLLFEDKFRLCKIA